MLLRGSADVLCWLGPTKLLASWAPTVLALGGCTASTCPASPLSPPYAPKSLWDLASAPGPIPAPRPSCRQAKATQPEGQNVPVLSFQVGFELCFLPLFED